MEKLLSMNSVGLIFDVVGVLVLAYALIFQSNKHLLAKAQTDWDYNQAVLVDVCKQRSDAIIGTLFLLAGFFGQLIAPIITNPDPIVFIALLALGALILIIYAFGIRQKWTDRKVARLQQLDREQFAKMSPP